jgi:uncharacterized membrane protein YeiH
LRADLYAVAALAGAITVVIGTALRFPSTAVTIAGAVLCFVIRFMAILRGWHLPIAGKPGQPTTPALRRRIARTTTRGGFEVN